MSNANLPAYPVSCVDDDGYMTGTQSQISGLTKREMFAMAAMQGILSTDITVHAKNVHSDHLVSHLSRKAVAFADALLAELERKP